ncbi:MAG: PAS domain S-box protein [Desulfobacteraceae bacterium]|nr:PAS domain S-box protein [Desulfobacteraceae bacterium]
MLQEFSQKFGARKFSLWLLGVWTALIAVSAGWNLYANKRDTIDKALVEARTIFEHNLAYRRWNTLYGGVYAPATEQNPPNTFLPPEGREITTTDGRVLTLINPFRMTSQVYDLLRQRSPELAVMNRTVSLNPLDPENSPDPWERAALLSFEQGAGEVSEITQIEGRPYLRLLAPYVTEEKCLKCHAPQGYRLGDVRGGMSIAVPLAPYLAIAASSRNSILINHFLLWLLGSGAILLLTRSLARYETAMAESEEKFRIVSEHAHHFEWWIDERNEIAFISPSCRRITGYSREELTARPQLLFEIIHPDDRAAIRDHILNSGEGQVEERTFRIVTKDGQIRWLAHTCSPIAIEGRYRGKRGSNRDITDQKQLEEELLQAKKMECLGHFAAGVAHDFNNILTSVTTFAHLLEDEVEGNKEQLEDHFKHMLVAAKLGRNMTSNLLAFGSRQAARPTPIRLNGLIDEVASIIRALLTDEIMLRLSLADDELPVLADAHQVEQVLINLCTNARDAMVQGGVLRIETRRLALAAPLRGRFVDIPGGTYMALAVADSGFGIPPKNMPHIFEPFFSTKDRCRGTGLGLAIVDRIVGENGAYIDVQSEMGQGTTFRIFFPASGAVTGDE